MPTNPSRPQTVKLYHLAVAAMLVAMILSSCAPKVREAPKPDNQPPVNLEALDNDSAYGEGLKAFWLGDYKNAVRIFEGLATRIQDQPFKSKLSYSLACARLAAADTQEEFNKALGLWLEWENQSQDSDCPADPRLLTPILKNYRLVSAVKEQRQIKAPEPDCLKRLQDKEKEVINLQKQIKALEAIHREIQEKKKMTTQ